MISEGLLCEYLHLCHQGLQSCPHTAILKAFPNSVNIIVSFFFWSCNFILRSMVNNFIFSSDYKISIKLFSFSNIKLTPFF